MVLPHFMFVHDVQFTQNSLRPSAYATLRTITFRDLENILTNMIFKAERDSSQQEFLVISVLNKTSQQGTNIN